MVMTVMIVLASQMVITWKIIVKYVIVMAPMTVSRIVLEPGVVIL